MKQEWLYRVFVGLFFVALLAPAVGTLLLGPSEAVANETIVPLPRAQTPQGGVNWAYLSDAGDWFEKHFAFRKELITGDSLWKAKLLGTSAQSKVALGRGEWLFYAETVDDYTGADNITPRQAWCAARSMGLVRDWVEGEGARFVCTVAPNKLSLYPEKFAGSLERAGETAADRFARALAEEGVAYADLFEALGGAGEVLYHETDSHWTNKGAALGHDTILAALGVEGAVASYKPGSYQDTHEGDLHTMLYPASGRLDSQFVFEEPLQFTYDAPIRGADDINIYTTSTGVSNGSLLMFRDSFGNALHPLMAESFGHALFTRATPYDLTKAGEWGCVVLEIVERNVARLAEGAYLMPAPEMELSGEWPDGGGLVLALRQVEPNMPGYGRVTGTLPGGCDVDSPIYLEAGGAFYEAFPTAGEADGFSAMLPEGAALEGVLYWKDGGALRQAVEWAD